MLTLKARNTFHRIPMQRGGILAGNDILDGMMVGGKYSLKKFAHDAGSVYKSIPQPVKDMAVKVATDAVLAAVAAGRSDLVKGSKKAKSHMNQVRGTKLVKGSQKAKDHMAHLRSLKKK